MLCLLLLLIGLVLDVAIIQSNAIWSRSSIVMQCDDVTTTKEILFGPLSYADCNSLQRLFWPCALHQSQRKTLVHTSQLNTSTFLCYGFHASATTLESGEQCGVNLLPHANLQDKYIKIHIQSVASSVMVRRQSECSLTAGSTSCHPLGTTC